MMLFVLLSRFQNEIEALKMIAGDPAALKIIDYDLDERWMITEYYERGSLSKYIELFKGDVLGSLRALHPIVAVLATLHERGIVHRDIKPQNILVRTDNRLVLGDFGIVFIGTDNRPTEILERVGTRDWMAPWAHTGARIDDVQQNFDVFSLGKLLWSMIAGRPMLPFWYHRRREYDLTAIFPDDPAMHLINDMILDHCIVENEADCWFSAGELLSRINAFVPMLSAGGQLLTDRVPRPCRVCGIGRYLPIGDSVPLKNGSSFRADIYACSNCRHIQLFGIRDTPTAQDDFLESNQSPSPEENGRSPLNLTTEPSSVTRMPVLEFVDFSRVGMATLSQQMGFDVPTARAFTLRNSEERYQTWARSLKASITFKSIEGEEIHVDEAPWFKNARRPVAEFYFQSVDIGMLETAGVVCVFESGNTFYTAVYSDATRVKPGVALALGHWNVQLRIDGENFATQTYNFRLQIRPAGELGFVRGDFPGRAATP